MRVKPDQTTRRPPQSGATTSSSGDALIEDPAVRAAYASFEPETRRSLLALRHLILTTADETEGVGRVHESLRWGQPSFLTADTGSGSTIRIAPTGPDADHDYAMFFICHTNLVQDMKALFGGLFSYDGNRALLFDVGGPLPVGELRECVRLALTYHLRRRSIRRSGR